LPLPFDYGYGQEVQFSQNSRSICQAEREAGKPEKFRRKPLVGGSVYFQALCIFHCLRSLAYKTQFTSLYILLRFALSLSLCWACGKSNINSDVEEEFNFRIDPADV
jgi:hypothetical protein